MTDKESADVIDQAAALDEHFYGVGFFNTLRGLGLEPQSEKQAADLIEMAGHLRNIKSQAMAKEAAQATDTLGAINAQLRAMAGAAATPPAVDPSIKRAAADFTAQPGVVELLMQRHLVLQRQQDAAAA